MGAHESTLDIRNGGDETSRDDPVFDSLSTSVSQFTSTDRLYGATSAPELRTNPIRPKELLKNLRRFHREKVRQSSTDTQWAKQLVYEQTQKLLAYGKKQTGILRSMEYVGSTYERLESTRGNEFHVFVVLKTSPGDVVVEDVVPLLYSTLKLCKEDDDIRLAKLTDKRGYFRPEKTQNWLDKLAQDWNENTRSFSDAARVRTQKHGSAVEIFVRDTNRGGSVTAEMVPCLKIPDDTGSPRYYVPYSFQDYTRPELGSNADLSILWCRAFSLKERDIVSSLDRTNGGTCRLECLKILKFIFRSDRKLRLFQFYLIKTAFLHYNAMETEWRADQLGERFLGMLRYIQECLKRKDLQHYFLRDVNLLKGLSGSSIRTVDGRIQQLLMDERQLFSAISA
ncbi:cyclic GMP-AMP synthase-like [Montipora capricornis]|uniref:cyclic GMP-AMP synthase-like n=1 Tax=Montipora capricornis TaxID=246305 RepID=UPI0035F13465